MTTKHEALRALEVLFCATEFTQPDRVAFDLLDAFIKATPDPTPDPMTQAADVVAASVLDLDRAQQEGRALLAVLRVVGTVVVGEAEMREAASGEWGVWAQPDRANAIEFSARPR